MRNEMEELAELAVGSLEELSREELIDGLRKAIATLLNASCKNIDEIGKHEMNSILVLYLIDKYCEGKAVIQMKDLLKIGSTTKGFSVDKQEGQDFLEVTVIKSSGKLH